MKKQQNINRNNATTANQIEQINFEIVIIKFNKELKENFKC